MLKGKDHSWIALVGFLYKHNYSTVAAKLQVSAGESVVDVSISAKHTRHVNVKLTKFYRDLAAYYISPSFAAISTLWGDPKMVDDIWVPLKVEDGTQKFVEGAQISHVDMLQHLASSKSSYAAVVKGDPGTGKTTLTKKVAYDWAIAYSDGCDFAFCVVFVLPLRSVTRFDRFDGLAIDYYSSLLDIDSSSKLELLKEIKALGPAVLIVLDGLDEYSSFADSPLRQMVAPQFHVDVPIAAEAPPIISTKLIITSRPYACEKFGEVFQPLRYTICPLDDIHLDDFVLAHCQTASGVDRAKAFLKNNNDLVPSVPLILSFICYLAEVQQEIPSNLTQLYGDLIFQMFKRGSRVNSLEDAVDAATWKHSSLVQTTGHLAFLGCANVSEDGDVQIVLEFDEKTLRKCQVPNDSFRVGFLLHKFDVVQESVGAEFPHRSIQEFFAALYCFKQLNTGKLDRAKVINAVISDGQLCRFLLGICSQEQQFSQAIQWLSQSLEHVSSISDDTLSDSIISKLADCTDQDRLQFARLVFDSIDTVERKCSEDVSLSDENGSYWDTVEVVMSLIAKFQSKSEPYCAELKDREENDIGIIVASPCHPRNAKIAYLECGLEAGLSLRDRWDTAPFVLWNLTEWPKISSDEDAERQFLDCIERIDALPLVRTMALAAENPNTYYKFRLYSSFFSKFRVAQNHLKHFRFQFDRNSSPDFIFPTNFLGSAPFSVYSKKVLGDRDKVLGGEPLHICFSLTVSRWAPQSKLICHLIKFACDEASK